MRSEMAAFMIFLILVFLQFYYTDINVFKIEQNYMALLLFLVFFKFTCFFAKVALFFPVIIFYLLYTAIIEYWCGCKDRKRI